MNHSHNREGWPPPGGGQTHPNMQRGNEQQPPRPPGQTTTYGPSTPGPHQQPPPAPVLPPPPGSYYATPPQGGPSLPTIAGITHGSPGVSSHRPSQAPHEQNTSQPPSAPPQGPGYQLPGINQATSGPPLSSQQNYEREREIQEAREREARERDYNRRDQQAREREVQEREMRDRQMREQGAPHQNSTESVQLHQPVPQMQSAIHGPNGLLANTGPQGNPNATSVAPNHPSLFGPQYEGGQRGAQQQPGQLPLPNVPPFSGTPGASQIPMPAIVQGQQPILNDALTYLDQVKVQFAGEPNVYNQFLDIMKDFKSQAIDTPGVIRRVSNLFSGNPNLIQGFNTFLPPGYRIECGTADDPNAIRVTTPMGTIVSPRGTSLDANPRPPPGEDGAGGHDQQYDSQERSEWLRGQLPEGVLSPSNRHQALPLFNHEQAQGRRSPYDTSGHRDQGLPTNAALLAHQQEQRGVSQLQNAVSAATGEPISRSPQPETGTPGPNGSGGAGQQGSAQSLEKRGPVEFNHAISYVNKIKNRFSSQPEIYKQFLEILQTYQRESKPIQDVYAQVTSLFNGAPDLLEDFKQFLPESAAHAKAVAARQAAEDATMLSNVRGDHYGGPGPVHHTPRPERLPPMGNFNHTPSANRDGKRKRAGDRQATGPSANTAVGDYGVAGSSKNGFGPNKRAKQTQNQQPPPKLQVQPDIPQVDPTLVPALPQPMAPSTSSGASSDELAFFDRVKKHIGNKGTMNEFLKLCNLFSQDLLDKDLLVYRVQNFIGSSPELMAWFKNFVGYDGKDKIIENRAKPLTGRVNLNNCRLYGPSYRYLPRRERMKTCSGRDELCNSVLNDEWASHPTWASEDSGFIAHRKNIHEEGLHRIEEERHDYDLGIAAADRFIQILEPLAQQNRMKSEAERERWNLPENFGGQSQAIYKKVLTKIYGRPAAQEVMAQLIQRPSIVVPVVLIRCRSMVESWKASQREWEKVWREQTQKMFWRSLDHQGIVAKMADKRQFQTKTLQNEIQTKYEEQRQKRQANKNVPNYQAECLFDDTNIIMDSVHLLLTYAEQSHSTDFPRLTQFIKDFMPTFFSLSAEELQQRIRDVFEASSNEEMEEDVSVVDDSTTARGRKGKKSDLLRDVLEKGRGTRSTRGDKDDSGSVSRASTPEVNYIMDEDATAPADVSDEEIKVRTWVNHPAAENKRNVEPNEPFKRSTFNLYANLPIYCFFKMFQFLYDRLSNLKENEKQVHEIIQRAKSSKAALDLKMVDKHPDNFFADTSVNANYYHQMLQMLEEFVRNDGSMDMSHIEETLRRYYLQKGWMLYSFDKLLSALVRFAIAILSNESKEKSWEIMQLFLKDRRKEMTTYQEELAYRKQVEKHVKEGDIYKISYSTESHRAYIRILKKEDQTFESASSFAHDGLYTPEQRWAYYISSYTTLDPTEGVPKEGQKPAFLKRNLQYATNKANGSAAVVRAEKDGNKDSSNVTNADEEVAKQKSIEWSHLDQLKSSENLGLKISLEQFKIFWTQPGSAEWWITEPKAKGTTTANVPTASDLTSAEFGEKPGEISDAAAADKSSDEASKPTEGVDAEMAEAETTTADTENLSADKPEGAHETHEQEHHDHGAEFEEKFIMNNKWMAGLSKDEVDKVNREFRVWKGEDVPEASEAKQEGTAGEGEDAEMKD